MNNTYHMSLFHRYYTTYEGIKWLMAADNEEAERQMAQAVEAHRVVSGEIDHNTLEPDVNHSDASVVMKSNVVVGAGDAIESGVFNSYKR